MKCIFCDNELNKDEIALIKKLFSRQAERFMCLACLADYVGCSEEELKMKIEEFKEQGCYLFK